MEDLKKKKTKRKIKKPKKPNGFIKSDGLIVKPKKADTDKDKDTDTNKDTDKDTVTDNLKDIIDFYNNNIGLVTPYILELLSDYAKDMDNDVIIYAMKRAVESNARNINFIKKVLNNWYNSGVKTLLQAQEENKNFREKSTSISSLNVKEEFLKEHKDEK